ncbi:MAG: aldo/keto reductase [Caldithrix sp.]|nr:MAG: aldo/keto reductase [Caldithrix sp.]
MHTKQLGTTDLHLTSIGLGTWAIGGGGWKYGWGAQDEKESLATIHRALDLGINWIDTAPVYGLGRAEAVVGKAIKGMRHRPVIATKCGLVWHDGKNISGRLKRESVRAEVEGSLKRLQVNVIDLYQIHWPDPKNDIEEAWNTIADLVKEGTIRYAAVCNFNVNQIKRIEKIHPVASVQPPYSMLERRIENHLLPYCAKNNIGAIPYSPLQKGILTDKFTAKWVQSLPEDDHRRAVDKRFQEPQLASNIAFVESLKKLARKHGKSVANVAIAWALRRPEITSVIVGARRPGQIEETIAAGDWKLPAADISSTEDLLEKHIRT